MLHIEMAVNFEDWQDWATKNGIGADVVGYLTFAKNDLYDFDPKKLPGICYSCSICKWYAWVMFTRFQLTDIYHAVGEGLAVKSHVPEIYKLPHRYS